MLRANERFLDNHGHNISKLWNVLEKLDAPQIK